MGGYVYRKKLFSLLGLTLYRCAECGSIYYSLGRRHHRLWGLSCSRHLGA